MNSKQPANIEPARSDSSSSESNSAVSDPTVLIAAAETSFQQGDHAAAILSLKHALELRPDNFDLLIFLGNVQYHAKDLVGAVACFTRATVQRPDALPAHLSRASALVELGDFVESEASVRVALALEPDNLSALKILSRLLLRGNRFKDLAPICEVILQHHGSDTDTWLALGRCRYELGDLQGAHKAFEQVRSLDPSNQIAADNLAHLRTKRDRMTTASFPIPPAHLRYRVVSAEHSEEQYLSNGLASTGTIIEHWRKHGTGAPSRILDFGCGCGRVLRHLLTSPVFHGSRFDGCDIDAPAIEWCRENLIGTYYRSNQYPPLEYPNGTFDLIYGLSVFTHIDLASQRSWLKELARVLSDDGILILSVNGAGVWKFYQSTIQGDPLELSQKGFVFVANIADGVLPEWYQTSFNSVENIQQEFGAHFEILQHASQGLSGFQDLLVLRKKRCQPVPVLAQPPATVPEVIREIAAGDEMFTGNKDHYFGVGASARHCIENALASVGRDRSSIRRVLDLPCGHGRVMRNLKAAFPQAQLTACDLNRNGVDFCAKAFGAVPVYSHADVAQIQLQGKFDLIWCGSLLTHLRFEPGRAFVGLFNSLLEPGGMVIFTLCGRWVERVLATGRYNYNLTNESIAALLKEYHTSGFGYVDYPSQSGYGLTLCNPAFALSQLVTLPDLKLITYHEKGWDNHQDVLCFQKQPPSELLG